MKDRPYEPNLDLFKARYDAGEFAAYEKRDTDEPLAPKLTLAEYRALTPEEKKERYRLQRRNYCRKLTRRKVYAK